MFEEFVVQKARFSSTGREKENSRQNIFKGERKAGEAKGQGNAESEIEYLKGQNARRISKTHFPENEKWCEVAVGVELAKCELEHGEIPDVAPSTSPVHMPGLKLTASFGTPCILPDARSGTEWRSAASSWTPCILQEARSSTEWKPKKAGSCGTHDDCCDVPPISVPRLRKV